MTYPQSPFECPECGNTNTFIGVHINGPDSSATCNQCGAAARFRSDAITQDGTTTVFHGPVDLAGAHFGSGTVVGHYTDGPPSWMTGPPSWAPPAGPARSRGVVEDGGTVNVGGQVRDEAVVRDEAFHGPTVIGPGGSAYDAAQYNVATGGWTAVQVGRFVPRDDAPPPPAASAEPHATNVRSGNARVAHQFDDIHGDIFLGSAAPLLCSQRGVLGNGPHPFDGRPLDRRLLRADEQVCDLPEDSPVHRRRESPRPAPDSPPPSREHQPAGPAGAPEAGPGRAARRKGPAEAAGESPPTLLLADVRTPEQLLAVLNRVLSSAVDDLQEATAARQRQQQETRWVEAVEARVAEIGLPADQQQVVAALAGPADAAADASARSAAAADALRAAVVGAVRIARLHVQLQGQQAAGRFYQSRR